MSEIAEKGIRIEVIQAAYGGLDGKVPRGRDVTQTVQQLVDRGRTSFVANNENLGGDPARGTDKHFAMSYRVGTTTYTFACDEGQTVTVQTSPRKQGPVRVIGAAYGAINPDDTAAGSRDVTAIVQQVLDSRGTFTPSNALFGDPFEGPTKSFGMVYVIENRTEVRVVREGQPVTVY